MKIYTKRGGSSVATFQAITYNRATVGPPASILADLMDNDAVYLVSSYRRPFLSDNFIGSLPNRCSYHTVLPISYKIVMVFPGHSDFP